MQIILICFNHLFYKHFQKKQHLFVCRDDWCLARAGDLQRVYLGQVGH